MDLSCDSMSVVWPRTWFLTRGQSILRFNFITSVNEEGVVVEGGNQGELSGHANEVQVEKQVDQHR
jgi:hypothetical protein